MARRCFICSAAQPCSAHFYRDRTGLGCQGPLSRLLFGAGMGLLVYLIRTWGGYPDGVAFAVLLMNLGVPALDRFAEARQRRPLT